MVLEDDRCAKEQALLLAAARGDEEGVRALLADGARLDVPQAETRYLPHMTAAQNGHVGVLDALLRAGAPLEADDMEGLTALHTAAAFGEVPCVRRLLAAGADPAPRPLRHRVVPMGGGESDDEEEP